MYRTRPLLVLALAAIVFIGLTVVSTAEAREMVSVTQRANMRAGTGTEHEALWVLEAGYLRLRCAECGHDELLAFSCKRRGFCPSCGARRMSPPVRQRVLSLPIPMRLLLAAQPELITPVL